MLAIRMPSTSTPISPTLWIYSANSARICYTGCTKCATPNGISDRCVLSLSNVCCLNIQMQWALITVLLCLLATCFSTSCGKDETEVMVAFHPHLDAFWLNTEEELRSLSFVPFPFLYQMNQRNSKQIFNSMYEALTATNTTADRRYFVSEVFFMKDWYDYVDQAKKDKFK